MCVFVTLTNENVNPPRQCTAKLLVGSGAPVDLLISPEMAQVLHLPKEGEGSVGGGIGKAKTDIHGHVRFELPLSDPNDLQKVVGRKVESMQVESKQFPHLYGQMLLTEHSERLKQEGVDGTLGGGGLHKLGMVLDFGRAMLCSPELHRVM